MNGKHTLFCNCDKLDGRLIGWLGRLAWWWLAVLLLELLLLLNDESFFTVDEWSLAIALAEGMAAAATAPFASGKNCPNSWSKSSWFWNSFATCEYTSDSVSGLLLGLIPWGAKKKTHHSNHPYMTDSIFIYNIFRVNIFIKRLSQRKKRTSFKFLCSFWYVCSISKNCLYISGCPWKRF